jgi:hypothetical protein
MESFAWDLGVAMYSEYDADGFLGIQVDVYGEEQSGCPALEAHGHFGFLSRPRDPDPDGAGCHALYAWEGNRGHVWLAGDPRVTAKLPRLKKGGSVHYCAAGGYALFDGESGAYTVHVPAGASVTIECDGGPKATVGPANISLGGDAAQPLVSAPALQAYLTLLELWMATVSKAAPVAVELGKSTPPIVFPMMAAFPPLATAITRAL